MYRVITSCKKRSIFVLRFIFTLSLHENASRCPDTKLNISEIKCLPKDFMEHSSLLFHVYFRLIFINTFQLQTNTILGIIKQSKSILCALAHISGWKLQEMVSNNKRYGLDRSSFTFLWSKHINRAKYNFIYASFNSNVLDW